MRVGRLLKPVLMLSVLRLSVMSPCYAQSPGSSEYGLPSDELIEECLSSPCGPIIQDLVNQNEKDSATIRLLRIDLRSVSARDSLEASYWKQQYQNERGNVWERAARSYAPALLFVVGVWVGASAAN